MILDTILTGTNAEYLTHLYMQYLSSPNRVDESWQEVFDGLSDTETMLLDELTGASWDPVKKNEHLNTFDKAGSSSAFTGETSRSLAAGGKTSTDSEVITDSQKSVALDSMRALMLIRAYRARGHLLADLDPLDLKEQKHHPELNPSHYGFDDEDYSRKIFLNGVLGLNYATLNEILRAVRQTYCGKIGVEFLHLTDPDEKSWIQQRIEEPRNKTEFTDKGKRAILESLTAAEIFETFLHKKYPGTKRFGIDGGEVLIPAIEQIIKRGGQGGLKEIVIGMSHRGRLNVLANILGKPMRAIFSEFQGKENPSNDVLGSGDVKYHLGASGTRNFDGHTVHLSLTANPSHLEFVNPVVEGKVRAKQVRANDVKSDTVLPLLLHGDAAFAGQGIIAETLMISELPGYRVGGTIHIVVNNQIGFTTMPQYSRSGPYPTDVAKTLAAPIFHVNGDDPQAVVHVARIATEFRQKFKRDVVIDIVCYRRHGHNEGDEPMFTQPLMYKEIAKHDTTRTIYERNLVAQRVLTQQEADEITANFTKKLDTAFGDTKDYIPPTLDVFGGDWQGLTLPETGARRGKTSATKKDLLFAGSAISDVPQGFVANKKLLRILDAKKKMMEGSLPLDWATAEALAFGTLLMDGYIVRLSGQDVGRGTFSQRHAVWYDQETGEKHIPLTALARDKAIFGVHDSPLSEAAVMGFEYGYSLADPYALVIWEGQFGDFANGAQVHIDQFLASGESKWAHMSGLVLLLPHGFEGQGPEHSSARLERFLQLSAEDNWQVCNCTTPANYFHVLRRQMCRNFRKPLVLMTPKSLLRHKLAVSDISELSGKSTFHRFLWDDDLDKLVEPKKVKRIVMCSGKVYFDLLQERREREIYDVMILRLEQLYPFPCKDIMEEIKPYTNADVVWCQEEPQNQGAWHFVDRRIEEMMRQLGRKNPRPEYAGRAEAAAPATGLNSRHVAEQAELVKKALL